MIYYPRAISNTDSLLLFVLLCVLNVLLPEGNFEHRQFVVVLLCVLNVLLPQGNFCTPSFIIKFAGCFTV